MKSYQQFFAELKRRKVFRVMAVYGATAFVVLQVADLLAEGMGLSDQVLRITTFLVLIGFPIAIVLAWAFETTPDGVRLTEDATDEELEAIVAQPASRRWPAGLLALAGAALLFGGWWLGQRGAGEAGLNLAPAGAEAAGLPKVAVLPFEDLGGNEEDDPLLLGFHAVVIDKLTTLGDLRVTQPASVRAYANSTEDARQVALELDADHVLRGSVQRAGNQVRINVSLEDVRAKETRSIEDWTGEVTVENVFQVQSQIALAVARELQAQLSPQDIERLETGLSTTNTEAINAFHRGRTAWWSPRGGGADTVFHHLERAVELDPGFVEAWALLARVLSQSSQVRSELSARALEAVVQTESLAPESLEAVKARGWHTYYVERDFRRALALMREAERRAPSDADVLSGIGFIQHRLGEFDEGNRTIKRSADLDPLNAGRLWELADVLARVAKWGAADAILERALAIDPANTLAQIDKARLILRIERDPSRALRTAAEMGVEATNQGPFLAEFALMERDYDAAAQILAASLVDETNSRVQRESVLRLAMWAWMEQQRDGDSALVLDSLRAVLGSASTTSTSPDAVAVYRVPQAIARVLIGEEETGIDLLDKVVQEARASHDRLTQTDRLWLAARAYAQFGRTGAALDLLEQVVTKPTWLWWSVAVLHLDPRFDSLRDDPRFDSLVARQEAYEAAQAREAETEDWLP